MEQSWPGGTVVFSSRRRVRCQESWAVLNAAGVPAEIVRRGREFRLVVREEDAPRAVEELDDYRRESQPVQPEPELVARSGGPVGVLVYAAVLVAVAALADRRVFGADWVGAGRAQAGAILDGEWWRAATALTLHSDEKHLFGNLAFGAVFGLLAAQRLGGGVAWLVILVGGVVGNAANAFLQNPTHSAIGASTAVFAALGSLVSLALAHRSATRSRTLMMWSPLVAGVLLLAWTGMGGERTDVLAHVTGLVAGLVFGAASGLVPHAVLDSRVTQVGASILALAILVLAWAVALP